MHQTKNEYCMFIEKIGNEDFDLFRDDDRILKGDVFDVICGLDSLDQNDRFPAFGYNEYF